MPWLMPSPAASAALRARRTPIRSPGWPTEPRFGPGWRPRWLARPNRRGGNQAVLFVDLDDFKDVNDALGHAAGDELLRVVAERLSSEVRIGDLVARLGGDEFALLLDGLFDPDRAYTVAERVVVTLAEPVQIGDSWAHVGASVGLVVARHLLKADVGAAADRRELVLDYQPVVDLETGALVGLEALVRWLHPTQGLLPPSAFIDVAEETGAIIGIGAWVLATATHQVHCWQRRYGLPGLW